MMTPQSRNIVDGDWFVIKIDATSALELAAKADIELSRGGYLPKAFIPMNEIVTGFFANKWEYFKALSRPKKDSTIHIYEWQNRKKSFEGWVEGGNRKLSPNYREDGIRAGFLEDTFHFTQEALNSGAAFIINDSRKTVPSDFITWGIDFGKFVGEYPMAFFKRSGMKTALVQEINSFMEDLLFESINKGVIKVLKSFNIIASEN